MQRLSLLTAAFALGMANSAGAAEITLIAPGGIRAAVEQMIPAFEKKTGHKVKATFGSGNGTKAQVTKGEAFDVPIVQPPYPEVLASGNVVTIEPGVYVPGVGGIRIEDDVAVHRSGNEVLTRASREFIEL